jgi:hypothetical protein
MDHVACGVAILYWEGRGREGIISIREISRHRGSTDTSSGTKEKEYDKEVASCF